MLFTEKQLLWAKTRFSDLLLKYKSNATKRGLEFAITTSQFYWLTQQNCFFCGTTPENKIKSRKRIYLEQKEFIHNGIDRWYSHLGYTPKNCVPCCKTCNYAKRSLSGEAFIKWIVGVATYSKQLEVQWSENKKP
jgi:hypothetical protein